MTCAASAGPWAGSLTTDFCVCNQPDHHDGPHSCGCGASWISTEAKL